jgi:glycine/D-amino acid oxidase-like deaminating enzyme/nitrite reductase/ring-hydroxylating ferredoxin subunit
MGSQPEGSESFWLATTPRTAYPALTGEVKVDVAVIGAGITGVLTGYLLKQEDRTVGLLDSKRILRGATGYTTAKLTAGHGVLYAELIATFGEDGARVYAESNQAAIERVAAIARDLAIDCDLERKPNYVYAEHDEEVERLRSEVEAMRRVGLPAAYVTAVPLPFPVAGAIRLDGQAQFHPRKFLLPLADRIPGDGSHVFEESAALTVKEGEPCEVRTNRGIVRAREVVVATHLPFLDRGLFFTKAHPHRSYAVAAALDGDKAPEGMFINAGTPTRSIRTLRDGQRTLLQVGGQGHVPGEEADTPRRYRIVEDFLREHWPAAGEVEYRWSTQDYLSVDRVPYVGRLRRRSKHVRIATGYSKWGMSNGTVAALLLADAVLGRENPWAPLYDAKRVKPRAAAKRFLAGNASAGWHLVRGRVGGTARGTPEGLEPGEGAILRLGARRRACYRDDGGVLHVLSPVCAHLGCIVAWNPAERTWDCPCHGSRYTGEGKVIQGPAVRDLERKEER